MQAFSTGECSLHLADQSRDYHISEKDQELYFQFNKDVLAAHTVVDKEITVTLYSYYI